MTTEVSVKKSRRRIVGVAALVGLPFLAWASWFVYQGPAEPPVYEAPFQPRKLMNKQPIIVLSETRTAAEVADAFNPAELMLGIVIEGKARAYPINMLNEAVNSKIVNDTLGGKKIFASF